MRTIQGLAPLLLQTVLDPQRYPRYLPDSGLCTTVVAEIFGTMPLLEEVWAEHETKGFENVWKGSGHG